VEVVTRPALAADCYLLGTPVDIGYMTLRLTGVRALGMLAHARPKGSTRTSTFG
jgi:hypothetical protein